MLARLRFIPQDERFFDLFNRSAANTLEGAQAWAILGPTDGHYDRVSRADLPARLLAGVERWYKERAHG